MPREQSRGRSTSRAFRSLGPLPGRYLRWLYVGARRRFLSIGDIHTFTEGMTRGAGYLAIAAVIFGKWTIGGTVLACPHLFGTASALQFQLPTLGMRDIPECVTDHAAILAGTASRWWTGRTTDRATRFGRAPCPSLSEPSFSSDAPRYPKRWFNECRSSAPLGRRRRRGSRRGLRRSTMLEMLVDGARAEIEDFGDVAV